MPNENYICSHVLLICAVNMARHFLLIEHFNEVCAM